MKAKELDTHPAAEIFPRMSGEEFANLKADIAAKGQRESIKLFGNKILDGRNRYHACRELDREPVFESVPTSTDPIEYVLSLNLHRRHLNDSQRAIVAAKVANLENGTNRYEDKVGSSNGEATPAVSQGKAAKLLNVSKKAVERAKAVITHGEPELIEAVESGDVSLSDAADSAKDEPEKQRAGVAAVKGGKAKTMKAAKQKEPRGTYDDTQKMRKALAGMKSEAKELRRLKPKAADKVNLSEQAGTVVAELQRLITQLLEG